MTDNKDYDAWENAEIKPVENRYTKLAAEAPQGDWENAKPTEGVGFFKDTLRDAVIYLANKKSSSEDIFDLDKELAYHRHGNIYTFKNASWHLYDDDYE